MVAEGTLRYRIPGIGNAPCVALLFCVSEYVVASCCFVGWVLLSLNKACYSNGRRNQRPRKEKDYGYGIRLRAGIDEGAARGQAADRIAAVGRGVKEYLPGQTLWQGLQPTAVSAVGQETQTWGHSCCEIH